MVTTNKQLIRFFQTAQAYLNSSKDNTKLTYALRKVMKRVEPAIEEYNEELQDVRAENAATDPNTGTFLEGSNGSFKYTQDGLKKLNAKTKELLKKTINLPGASHYVEVLPPDLHQEFVDAFVGFVIDPDRVDEDGFLIPADECKCDAETCEKECEMKK